MITKGFKFFIGYENNNKIKQLRLILKQINGYDKCFDETKHVSCFIKNKIIVANIQ